MSPVVGSCLLHFSVTDTGIGIPADQQQIIFDPFVQGDSSTTRVYGGTGLGLSISSRLVELMGGGIWVESKLGHGSTFHFTTCLEIGEAGQIIGPAQPDSSGEPASDPRVRGRALRILVAEDHPVNQTLLRHLLDRRGHTVVFAGNGRQAIEAFKAQPFDVVLMDVSMPEMDGFEAAAQIRDYEQSAGTHVPIIALTAHAFRSDLERCLAAGMDGFVAKPIKVQELERAIEGVAPISEPPGAATPGPADAVIDRAAALALVDGDDSFFRGLVRIFLGESPRILGEIREAIRQRDAGKLQRVAHSLKGLVGSFGAPRAGEAARALESLGREENLARAAEGLATLEQEIGRLNAALEAVLGEAGDG